MCYLSHHNGQWGEVWVRQCGTVFVLITVLNPLSALSLNVYISENLVSNLILFVVHLITLFWSFHWPTSPLGIYTIIFVDDLYSSNTNHTMPYIINDFTYGYVKIYWIIKNRGVFSPFLITPDNFGSVFKMKDNYGIIGEKRINTMILRMF